MISWRICLLCCKVDLQGKCYVQTPTMKAVYKICNNCTISSLGNTNVMFKHQLWKLCTSTSMAPFQCVFTQRVSLEKQMLNNMLDNRRRKLKIIPFVKNTLSLVRVVCRKDRTRVLTDSVTQTYIQKDSLGYMFQPEGGQECRVDSISGILFTNIRQQGSNYYSEARPLSCTGSWMTLVDQTITLQTLLLWTHHLIYEGQSLLERLFCSHQLHGLYVSFSAFWYLSLAIPWVFTILLNFAHIIVKYTHTSCQMGLLLASGGYQKTTGPWCRYERLNVCLIAM